MEPPAIRANNLVKRFEQTVAVDHVSFEVAAGELFGLLGPNGAGKTTILNILSTLLKPTEGTAEVAGIPVLSDRDGVRRQIGVVFQDPALDIKLTGRENLQFHAMMYGLPREERRKRIAEVLELVEMEEKADQLVEKYSGGMKRRLEIARGLIQHPRILFLDEPTLGLDAQTRRHIWEYIRSLNREKRVAIILTTHYMEEADFLCDRVAIMDRGRIIALDRPEKLKESLGGDMVHLEIDGESEVLKDRLAQVPWIKEIKMHDGLLTLTMKQGDRRIPELLVMMQQCEVQVRSVNLHRPSLEDVFLLYTGKTIREEEILAESQFTPMRHGRTR